ncbi:MAG: hypothetical protein ACM3ZB_09085, partial [bacterium]
DVWLRPELAYLAIADDAAERIKALVGEDRMIKVASAGGKSIFANQPVQKAEPGLREETLRRGALGAG